MLLGTCLAVPQTVLFECFLALLGLENGKKHSLGHSEANAQKHSKLDEGQITHLICVRLKYDLYDFFRGCFGPFLQENEQEAGPKHPLKKSYRSYFRRAQIR